jgi:hypothetical protein
MKKTLLAAAWVLGLCALPRAAAVPVQYMSPLSLAAEYYGALNGHYALCDFDSSALGSHFLRLHYSPAKWLRLTGGVGGSAAYASPAIEGAKFGLALTGGAGFYLPRLTRWLSLTAGYDFFYMNAREETVTYKSRLVPRLDPATGAAFGLDTVRYVSATKNGATTAGIHAPGAGLIFHLGRFANCEVGGVYQYFNVSKKDRSVTATKYDDAGKAVTDSIYTAIGGDGGLMDQMRLYAAVTLQERESGAFVASGASYALTNAATREHTILPNFSFWWQIGLIMRDPRGGRERGLGHGWRDIWAYAELEEREERMADELRHGAGRHESRRRGGNRPASEGGGRDAVETETGGEGVDAAATEE